MWFPYAMCFHVIFTSILILTIWSYLSLQGSDLFTPQGMPKVPFPSSWKGENGLYSVGFTMRGLLGASSDAMKIAGDIAQQWTTEDTKNITNTQFVLSKQSHRSTFVIASWPSQTQSIYHLYFRGDLVLSVNNSILHGSPFSLWFSYACPLFHLCFVYYVATRKKK